MWMTDLAEQFISLFDKYRITLQYSHSFSKQRINNVSKHKDKESEKVCVQNGKATLYAVDSSEMLIIYIYILVLLHLFCLTTDE